MSIVQNLAKSFFIGIFFNDLTFYMNRMGNLRIKSSDLYAAMPPVMINKMRFELNIHAPDLRDLFVKGLLPVRKGRS